MRLSVEGARMVEGVSAVQNPAVAGVDGNRRVAAGVAGHRHQNDAVVDDVEGLGRGESAPGLPVGAVLYEIGVMGPLRTAIADALTDRGGVDGAASFGGGDVDVGVREV